MSCIPTCDRRGIRAAGLDGGAVRVCHQQRALAAAVENRTPYDPQTQKGHVGRNYCYQAGRQRRDAVLRGQNLQPVHGHGGVGYMLDDFHANRQFDRGPVGGGWRRDDCGQAEQRPTDRLSPGAGRDAALGRRVEESDRKMVLPIDEHRRRTNSNMPNRYNCLRPRPDVSKPFGQPLLRLTQTSPKRSSDGRHISQKAAEIGRRC